MQKTLHEIREECEKRLIHKPWGGANVLGYARDLHMVIILQEIRLRRLEELNLNEHQGDARKIFLTVKD